MRSQTLGVVGIVAVVGCGSGPVKQEPPISRVDLAHALGTASVHPIGVAVAAGGDRFVFDEALGLYRLTAGGAVAVVPMSSLPTPDKPIQLPITDITSLAPGLFALTAIGDGFLLDTSAMTLKQHFCYVPDGTPMNLHQRTDAIAYDAKLDRLYAQPLTLDDRNVLQWSQLAAYDRDTGTSVQWTTLGNEVAATGMAVLPDVGLVFGQGAELSRVDVTTGQREYFDLLERFDIHSIDGLAVDAAAHTLLVVDSTTGQLVELDLAQLGRALVD